MNTDNAYPFFCFQVIHILNDLEVRKHLAGYSAIWGYRTDLADPQLLSIGPQKYAVAPHFLLSEPDGKRAMPGYAPLTLRTLSMMEPITVESSKMDVNIYAVDPRLPHRSHELPVLIEDNTIVLSDSVAVVQLKASCLEYEILADNAVVYVQNNSRSHLSVRGNNSLLIVYTKSFKYIGHCVAGPPTYIRQSSNTTLIFSQPWCEDLVTGLRKEDPAIYIKPVMSTIEISVDLLSANTQIALIDYHNPILYAANISYALKKQVPPVRIFFMNTGISLLTGRYKEFFNSMSTDNIQVCETALGTSPALAAMCRPKPIEFVDSFCIQK